MSNAIVMDESSNFELAVGEYTHKRTRVQTAFVLGVVELGEILHKYREVYKVKQKWYAYLKGINVHPTQANQQIRLYEYYKENPDKTELLTKTVTNWNKLNYFLSMSEENKNLVLESDIDPDASNQEFKDVIDGIEMDVETTEEAEVVISEDITKDQDYLSKGVENFLDNPEEISLMVCKEMGVSPACKEAVEGILTLERGIRLLEKFDTSSLNGSDKSKVENILKLAYLSLQEIYKNFATN